jgi:hypothetical protein
MKSIIVNSQGFELTWSVPETNEEYNSLAPKRNNPVLEDATSLIFLHSAATKFRDQLSTKLGELTSIKRVVTDDDEETQGKHIRRVFVETAKARGLDPQAKAARDQLTAEWTPLAQSIMSGIVFDPSDREATGGTPKVAKIYSEWATKAVLADGGAKLATLLGKVLNITIDLSGQSNEEKVVTLARNIAANEKRKRDLAASKEYDPTA